jgi:carbon storage regulator
MLVLSRKKNQAIVIRGKDGDIRIAVLDAEKGKVRLGIEAPKGNPILREEIVVEVAQANRESVIESIESIGSYLEGKGE